MQAEEDKIILRKVLTKEALQRLNNVKLVKPKLVEEIEKHIIRLYKANKIKSKITEEEIKTLLKTLSGV